MSDKASERLWVLVADAKVGKGLSDLPVVGTQIPGGAVELESLRIQLCSGNRGVSETNAGAINSLIEKVVPDGRKKALLLPKAGLSGRGGIGATVRLLGHNQPLTAPLGGTRGALVRADGYDGRHQADATVHPDGDGPGTMGLDSAPTAGAVWQDVDATLGPLRVRRIGLASARDRVWLLVDGGVSLSVISLRSIGLGVGLSLDGRYSVVGCLDGLGLDFTAGPVTLSGAFLRQATPTGYELKLGGLVTATIAKAAGKIPQLTIGAAGFYAHKSDGSVALFIYGELGGLRVGPPPFQVTGLMGGFGYNMRVDRPPLAEVAQFPLVAGLDGKAGDKRPEPDKVLADLAKVVHAAPGQICLAAGLTFTCFGLVSGKALLILQTGDEFVLSLLGIATAKFPQGKGSTTYAQATLGLKADYVARRGELSVEGELTEDSYVISRECKPKGGFAYCTWLDPSPHAGDFVVSIGGYHPGYAKPAHYPEVRRVGYEWAVASSLSIRGECYAAVTPSAFMIGGLWRAEFHRGRVKAWFSARVNALVQWQPFSFDLDVGVSVGVELDLEIKTIRLSLDVDLNVWGPGTGGVAKLRLPAGVGTVRIRFGEDRPAKPKWLDWDPFRTAVLGDRPLEVRAVTGLLPAPSPDTGTSPGRPVWTASTDGFTFATSSKVPISTVLEGVTGGGGLRIERRELTRSPITIRPMNLTEGKSEHTLTVRRHTGGGTTFESLEKWEIAAVTGGVPTSVWGKPLEKPGDSPPVPDGSTRELLPNQLLGLRVTVPQPTVRGTSFGPVAEKDLLNKEVATGPVNIGTTGPPWKRPVRGDRAGLAGHLADPAAEKAREALTKALVREGMTPAGPPARPGRLDGYSSRVWSYLPDDPALVEA
ncbi:DUF6603 domain-containing protein [Streptomyces olivoreticuli]